MEAVAESGEEDGRVLRSPSVRGGAGEALGDGVAVAFESVAFVVGEVKLSEHLLDAVFDGEGLPALDCSAGRRGSCAGERCGHVAKKP